MDRLSQIRRMYKKYGINGKASEILIDRDFTNESEFLHYINPRFMDLHDPESIPGIFDVINKIQQIAFLGGNIMLYGDYDVDGVMSASLLYKAIKKMTNNGDVNYYISNRYSDGYGLSKIAINEFARQNIDLIVALDCGITNQEEIEYARSLGMEVVVIDHHEAAEGPGCPFVDLKVEQGDYPFRELCGAGITYKVAQVMTGKPLKDLVDLVAVATVGDVVPLIGENRILVKEGIKQIRENKANRGLKKIIYYKDIEYEYMETHNDIGFKIAPMINAMGRLEDATEAVELMVTESIIKRELISLKMNVLNDKRNHLQNKAYYNALKTVNPDDNVIIYKDKSIAQGIVGPVAGRLQSEFNKPAIVIGEKNKGSSRSVKPLNIYELLGQADQYLDKYGGHEMAAGLTLKQGAYDNFYNEIQRLVGGIEYENETCIWEIELKYIDLKLVREIARMKPFGKGNPRPLFKCKDCELSNIQLLTGGKHLKFKAKESGSYKSINAIAFNMGNKVDICRDGNVDLIFELGINRWNGREDVQLKIKDIQKADIQSDHRLIS